MMHSRGGWSLVQSIAAEMDVALGAASGAQDGLVIAKIATDSLDPDWREQWPELMGRPRPWPGVLSNLASLAGVEGETDYSRATLPMRELTLAGALERVADWCREYGVTPQAGLEPAERLIDLMSRGAQAMETALGLQPSLPGQSQRLAAYEVGIAVRALRDGDRHSRFWHWLDRGYYEWYRPWRESQASLLAAEEQRALALLGAREGEGIPPLAWLSPQHPLHLFPEFQQAVQGQKLRVCFWTQPFGISDSWGLGNGTVYVTFAEPGTTFSSFRDRATELARRANAFSDPTRLMILRLIRNYSKDNTQMAEFLGVARPAVSTHAKILREAGLIKTSQEGRAAQHTIDYGAIRRLFADLARFLDLPGEE